MPTLRRLRVPVLALMLASLAFAGCALHEPWSFSVTRWSHRERVFHSGGGSAEFLLAALGVIVALDLMFLPVAVPHDIWMLVDGHGHFEDE